MKLEGADTILRVNYIANSYILRQTSRSRTGRPRTIAQTSERRGVESPAQLTSSSEQTHIFYQLSRPSIFHNQEIPLKIKEAASSLHAASFDDRESRIAYGQLAALHKKKSFHAMLTKPSINFIATSTSITHAMIHGNLTSFDVMILLPSFFS